MFKMSRKLSMFFSVAIFAAMATSARAQSQSLDELYKAALKEGGTVNFYGTLAQINAEKI